jgi:hypothetical protein
VCFWKVSTIPDFSTRGCSQTKITVIRCGRLHVRLASASPPDSQQVANQRFEVLGFIRRVLFEGVCDVLMYFDAGIFRPVLFRAMGRVIKQTRYLAGDDGTGLNFLISCCGSSRRVVMSLQVSKCINNVAVARPQQWSNHSGFIRFESWSEVSLRRLVLTVSGLLDRIPRSSRNEISIPTLQY